MRKYFRHRRGLVTRCFLFVFGDW